MAFSVFINEVVRMASLSRGYFVYAPGETKINHPCDKSRERLRIKTLKAMQERKLEPRISSITLTTESPSIFLDKLKNRSNSASRVLTNRKG